MTDAELRSTLVLLVVAQASVEPSAVLDETVLLGHGLDLDSLSLLDLVVSIDERLGVRAGASDVVPEHFGTFGRLFTYVRARVPQPRSESASPAGGAEAGPEAGPA